MLEEVTVHALKTGSWGGAERAAFDVGFAHDTVWSIEVESS